jgi:hypothetical protein
MGQDTGPGKLHKHVTQPDTRLGAIQLDLQESEYEKVEIRAQDILSDRSCSS